jgi:hypothetical protein
VAALPLALTLTACDMPVSPQPPATSTSEAGYALSSVVTARPNKEFVERDRVSAQGTRGKDGSCVLQRRFRVKFGEHVGERVVQYDVDSCSFVIARGDWVRTADHGADSVGADSVRASIEHPKTRPGYRLAGGDPPTLSWQKIWHEDPIGIHVTSDRLTFNTPKDQGCFTDVIATNTWDMFETSGWHVGGHGVDADIDWCGYTWAVGYSNYWNHAFCGPPDTWVDYSYNQIEVDLYGVYFRRRQ